MSRNAYLTGTRFWIWSNTFWDTVFSWIFPKFWHELIYQRFYVDFMQILFVLFFLTTSCRYTIRGRSQTTFTLDFSIRGRSQTTFTNFGFFWPPTPLRLHFLWYESLQKVNFFDHLPPSSCKRSLWTTPFTELLSQKKGFKGDILFPIVY